MSKHLSNKSKTYKRAQHTHLLDDLSYLGNIDTLTSIELIRYNKDEFISEQVSPSENLKNIINKNYINWFKVKGISDVQTTYKICQYFGISRFDIKDMLSCNRVTKAITYENTTFILTSECITTDADEPQFSQIAFILGKNYIVSFQETPENIFDEIQDAIETSRLKFREKGADYLLYFLVSMIHSSYNTTIIRLSDRLNNMEDLLIADNVDNINVMRFIQFHRREYTILKRTMLSMREEYINILHNTNKLIEHENMMYFNDYDDKLRTSLDDLEIYHASILSLSDLYFNNNNLKMNSVIKKLTIVSTIFIPLTFMVGVWGMNFEYMPELKWKHGYLFAWAIMFLIIICAIYYLKRKKWF